MQILHDDGGNTPPKPTPLTVQPENIPSCLTEHKHWVVWAYTWKDEKWQKIPYEMNGRWAKPNDPFTWTAFDVAVNKYDTGQFDGLGFNLWDGDDLAAIDLDHIWDPATRTLTNKEAKRVLKKFAHKAYIEFSPGGDGIRIFVKGVHGRCGKIPKPIKWLECYGKDAGGRRSNRFMTVTGKKIEGFSADEPQDCQEELDWLFETFMKKPDKPRSNNDRTPQEGSTAEEWPDDYVIERAKIAKNGAWFTSAFDKGLVFSTKSGEEVTDASAADLIFCNSLAFWTGRNAEQMDRLFHRSGLMRDKWDEIHYADGSTYGEHTIATAIDGCAESIHDQKKTTESLDWVAEFNAKYSPVRYVTKMAVAFLTFEETTRREVWTFISFETFKQMHCSEYAAFGTDKQGHPIMKAKGNWLTHPKRVGNREFYFDPSNPPKLEREGFLNLWVGFAVQGDSTGGDPNPMLSHLREVICQNDPDKIRYVMGWIALLIQKPGKRHEVALVLRGKKGSGKGTLGNLLCRIFGRHGLALSVSRHLTGNFNDHLLDCCFLFADEAFFAGDRSSEGSLKARITEPYLAIEPKGLPLFTAVNRLSILMATNSDYVVPASADERRYAVLDVSESRIGDREYFRSIHSWAQNDCNVAAFIEFMQKYDISDFEVRDVIETRELAEQREHSLPPWAQWWRDALVRGSFGGDRWDSVVSNQYLFASYAQYNTFRKFQKYDILGESSLGREINTHKLTVKTFRSSGAVPHQLIGGWNDSSQSKTTSRVSCRVVGELSIARAKFISAFGLPEDLFESIDEPTEGG